MSEKFEVEISLLHSNNKMKYFNECLRNFLKEKGIKH